MYTAVPMALLIPWSINWAVWECCGLGSFPCPLYPQFLSFSFSSIHWPPNAPAVLLGHAAKEIVFGWRLSLCWGLCLGSALRLFDGRFLQLLTKTCRSGHIHKDVGAPPNLFIAEYLIGSFHRCSVLQPSSMGELLPCGRRRQKSQIHKIYFKKCLLVWDPKAT